MQSQSDTCLDSSRFANDASKNSTHGAFVERAAVDLLQSLQDSAFAIRIAEGKIRGLFECADFESEAGTHVEKSQQFFVDIVNLFSPVLYVHDSNSRAIKKTSRDF
jgi:hypothetical protein